MDMDFKLLELLEEDGSLSEKELATMLGVSGKDVKARIAILRKKGVLRKTKAVVN